jgi:hypothetical protein
LTGGSGFIDVIWPGMLLAKHKSRSEDLGKAIDYLDSLPDHAGGLEPVGLGTAPRHALHRRTTNWDQRCEVERAQRLSRATA